MENRNGLAVDVSVSVSTGMAERKKSLKLLQTNTKSATTLEEGRGYDMTRTALRKVTARKITEMLAVF